MAQDVANSINYYLCIGRENDEDLAHIRHWSNLKVAHEDDHVWLKDLDYAQIHSVAIKSLPYKTIYYEKNGRLFLLNSLLPERVVPSLLWTPIERGLPVKLPSFNHNYFGMHDGVDIKLLPQDHEAEAVAMITNMETLATYIEGAATIRLEKIRWAIVGNDHAFLFGKPLLPLPGPTYWQRKDLLIPTGFDFELYVLVGAIQKKVNPGRDKWIVWDADASYYSIDKDDLQTLSRSSFRASYRKSLNTDAQ